MDLRIVLENVLQLVVADGDGRHAVEAVEDENVALAADVGHKPEREFLADAPIVGGRDVDRVGRAGVEGEERDTGVGNLLKRRLESGGGAERLNDRVGFLRDQRLDLRDLLGVDVARVEADRRSA